MTKVAIDMAVERRRVEVEARHRHLKSIAPRCRTKDEHEELVKCIAWLKKNARPWERRK